VRSIKRVAMGGIYRSVTGALAIGVLNADYCAHYGMPRSRIFLAPYTVDNAFFRDRLEQARLQARRLRHDLGIAPEDPVVLYAAKLIPAKACASLIHAFGSNHRGRAALVIVGDGPLRGELVALAKTYPSANVHFLGFVNQTQMPAAYALGNLFVLPSVYEPWGLAVNEAMNLGLPIVVSDQVGCAPDLVSPDNGWVFPADDSEALTRILDRALSDPDGLARRGQASSARIAGWDIAHTAQGFVHGARSVTHLSAPLAE
jgi:glycosyltransferase involved in cell wall biosynthesis